MDFVVVVVVVIVVTVVVFFVGCIMCFIGLGMWCKFYSFCGSFLVGSDGIWSRLGVG